MRKLVMVLAALAVGAAAPEGVTVRKPWMRYLLPNIPAGGYMVLQNTSGSDAVITGASSPACGSLMLHESQDTSGMSMMMDVPSVTVPAHGQVAFSPGGYHLMCMQPHMQPGQTIAVTLSFKDGATMLVTMPVYGASGQP
jgi:copper(I)-binding protein